MASRSRLPAGIVRAVALAALLAGVSEVLVVGPAASLATPEVAVDRLVADAESALEGETAGNLLGAPLITEEIQDQASVLGRDASVAP